MTVNGKRFDFREDPRWDERNNRRTYETTNVRPRFDFGWSPTHWAGGKAAGEAAVAAAQCMLLPFPDERHACFAQVETNLDACLANCP